MQWTKPSNTQLPATNFCFFSDSRKKVKYVQNRPCQSSLDIPCCHICTEYPWHFQSRNEPSLCPLEPSTKSQTCTFRHVFLLLSPSSMHSGAASHFSNDSHRPDRTSPHVSCEIGAHLNKHPNIAIRSCTSGFFHTWSLNHIDTAKIVLPPNICRA